VFQTLGERDLCRRQFGLARRQPHVVLGLGVETRVVAPDVARAALGLGDAPYLASVGRVEDGKGTTLLADVFARYKTRNPGPMKLVLAGDVVQAPPPHPDIVVDGPVDEDVKWSLLGGAVAFVQPSYYEAFSIALMEAWTAGVPAIVNGACVALKEHVDRSRGGLTFTDAPSFAAAVDRIVTNERARARLAARGRAYVVQFEWPGLIDRYTEFLLSL
jgi:glycosyltransferase involved in cell wall biosynthesis